MAEHDDLDDILDSALNGFCVANVAEKSNQRGEEDSSAPKEVLENTTLGQGLGVGLPALGSRAKRTSSSRTKSGGKTSSSSQLDDKSSSNGARLADTLEELALQTRQTLEGMDSNDQEAMADKLVESIVKQFQELGTSEDMQSIMDTMMRQLLSKEVLHEPMKEFAEKYPSWLEANKSSLSEEDFGRYSEQYGYIKELCVVYETESDDHPKIVDIMQKMQACGQPPNDLVQELTPGMDLGGDGVPFLSDLLQESGQGGVPNQNCSMM